MREVSSFEECVAYAEKKIWSYFASFEVLFTCFHVSDFGSLQGYDSWFLKKKGRPLPQGYSFSMPIIAYYARVVISNIRMT